MHAPTIQEFLVPAFRSIRSRLALGFSVILLGLAVVAVVAWRSNQRVGEAVEVASSAWSRIERLNQLQAEILRLQLQAAEFMRVETAAARAPLDATIGRIDATVAELGVAGVGERLAPLKEALQRIAEQTIARREAAVQVRDTGGATVGSFAGIQAGAARANEAEAAELAASLTEAVNQVLLGVARFQATANPTEIESVLPNLERISTLFATLRERTSDNRRLARQVNGAAQTLPGFVAAITRFREASEARREAEARLDVAATALTGTLAEAREAAATEVAQSRSGLASMLDLSGTTILAVSAVVVLLGGLAALLLGRAVDLPLRRLAAAIGAIAGGNAATSVPYRERRDEVGRIAEALEALRATVGRAFAQSQMLEQMPAAVMSADAAQGGRISYMNAAAGALMTRLEPALGVPAAALLGREVELVFRAAGAPMPEIRTPAELPASCQLRLGGEVLDLRLSALHDTTGAYTGAMLAWQVATEKLRLADTFEHEVGAVVDAVASSAQRLLDSAQGLSAAAELSGREAAAVAEAGSQAHDDVRSVAAAAEEMASSVAEISRQVGEAAQVAAHAVMEAQATDQTVLGLSEAAARIGDVVRLIGDIAGQTNLLALNATIEAARAGEAGKGFAVVASEVKALAAETARATSEISRQINDMQAATAQAVTAIRGIGSTVEKTSEIASSIAAAVEQQGAATQEIARSAAEVARATETVAGRIVQVRQAGDETGRSALGMRDDSTALAGQAALLREKAGHFLEAVRAA
jgi:methyl-accepting chemotaxis protein